MTDLHKSKSITITLTLSLLAERILGLRTCFWHLIFSLKALESRGHTRAKAQRPPYRCLMYYVTSGDDSCGDRIWLVSCGSNIPKWGREMFGGKIMWFTLCFRILSFRDNSTDRLRGKNSRWSTTMVSVCWLLNFKRMLTIWMLIIR